MQNSKRGYFMNTKNAYFRTKLYLTSSLALLVASVSFAQDAGNPYPSWWVPLDSPPSAGISGVMLYSPNITQPTTGKVPYTFSAVAMPTLTGDNPDYSSAVMELQFYAVSSDGLHSASCTAFQVVYTCTMTITQPGTYTVSVAAVPENHPRYVLGAYTAKLIITN